MPRFDASLRGDAARTRRSRPRGPCRSGTAPSTRGWSWRRWAGMRSPRDPTLPRGDIRAECTGRRRSLRRRPARARRRLRTRPSCKGASRKQTPTPETPHDTVSWRFSFASRGRLVTRPQPKPTLSGSCSPAVHPPSKPLSPWAPHDTDAEQLKVPSKHEQDVIAPDEPESQVSYWHVDPDGQSRKPGFQQGT